MNKLKLSILIFSFFPNSYSLATEDKNEVQNKKLIKEFVLEIIGKNEKIIVEKYLHNSKSFTKDGKINPDISKFLFGKNNSHSNGILSIVSKENFTIKSISQGNNIYTVLVTNKQHSGDLENISFLQNHWMLDYFACEVEIKSDQISLYQNVCFAETDGPFPIDHG